METDSWAAAAYSQLRSAMDNSVKLMDLEYYAMRLVIEAKGYTDYPELLEDVKLTDEDTTLSADEKIRHATEIVPGDDYYELKDRRRSNVPFQKERKENLHVLLRKRAVSGYRLIYCHITHSDMENCLSELYERIIGQSDLFR